MRYKQYCLLFTCWNSNLFAVVNETVSLVISRQLLTEVSNHLSTLSDEVSKKVSHFMIEKVQPRVVSFEEQVSSNSNTITPGREFHSCQGQHKTNAKQNLRIAFQIWNYIHVQCIFRPKLGLQFFLNNIIPCVQRMQSAIRYNRHVHVVVNPLMYSAFAIELSYLSKPKQKGPMKGFERWNNSLNKHTFIIGIYHSPM